MAVICVSDDEKRHAEHDLKIPARLLHTVVNGVVQPPSGQRDQIRAGWNIAPDSFVFGFVGRLSAQKAPERLIEAFRRIAPALPQAKLVMIGFGELQQAVEAQIRETGLGGRIVLTSEISGSSAMQAFDALVMPSRYEAMSYVMLEAAAAGLPMVLSDVGGASTVLKDGENGFLVANEDDPAALAAAMQALAAPDRYGAIKAAAEARSQNYSLEAMVAATEAVYRSLV